MVIIDCTCPLILIMVLNYITKLHVFLQSHFEARSTFVVGSILSTGFSYFSLAHAGFDVRGGTCYRDNYIDPVAV